MCGSWISTWPIAFYVLSLATDSFEELIMIRGPVVGTSRQLTCVAEDDGSALVLNLQVPSSPRWGTPTWNSFDSIVIDNSTEDYSRYWKLTDTYQSPMGPVFDYRWEGFYEHPVGYGDPKGLDHGYYYTVFNRGPQSSTIVFSARGLGDIHMILCEAFKPWDVSCARITITAGPEKTTSNPSLRNTGRSETTSSEDCQNRQKYRELDQPLISKYEWRTFIFDWEKSFMKIQAYNNGCVFVTNETRVDLTNKTNIFIAASSPGLVRPHIYKYYQTTHGGTTLLTRRFHQDAPELCIELLVSLCPECELIVKAVKAWGFSEWMIGKISGDTKSAFGKLPTWRLERLNVTLPDFDENWMKLKISTQTNDGAVDGRWAIDHFRKCSPVDAVRKYTSSIDGVWHYGRWVYPIAGTGCQKLSYTENSVVKGDDENPHNISSDLLESLRKKIHTHLFYDATKWYRGRSFCDQTGCTCAPGFDGSDCLVACNDGFYGYACQERCGNCKPGTCSTTTGFCTSCTDHYLPPNCKTILQLQDVMNADQTTAMLHLPYYPELDGGKIESLHFELKTSDENWMELVAETPNTTVFDVRLCGLVPETKYTVIAVLQVQTADKKKIYLESEEKIFITRDSDKRNVPDLAPSLIGTCNIDGENPRTSPSLSFPKDSRPSDPLNLKVTSRGKGRIMVKWDHPPYICKRISRFFVKVTLSKSNLQNYMGQDSTILRPYAVEDHEQAYSMEFDLWASTCYKLSVQPIYSYGPAGKATEAVFQVPSSMGFSDGEVPKAINHGTFINLQVPALFETTRNSNMLVVVKGSLPCNKFPNLTDDMRSYLNMTASEPGWIAEDISILENTPQNLTIGENSTDMTSEACPLPPAEDYVVVIVLQVTQVDRVAITVLVKKPGSNDGENEQLSIVWIFILLILMICIFLLFIWRRKFWNTIKRMRQQNLASYSQALSGFVKLTTTRTPHQLPPVPESTNADPIGIQSIPEVVAWSRYSHPVDVDEFENYVKDSISSGLLQSQFAMFERGLNRPSNYGSLQENKPKNRYPNIIPYEDTRVVLKKLANDRYSDYINANYVHSFDRERCYIAAQAPKPQTVVDFWRMIWQEKARIICMLTNLVEGQKVKSEQYWPEYGDKKKYGDIVVVTEKYDVSADYTFRTFRVSCKEESRKIEHMHFTGWPDHSVPTYSNSVIKYLKRVQALSTGKAPIIVHCSAGIGRTGTVILCDICSRQASLKGTIDVLAAFRKLRDCRMNLVDNELQYLFVHVVLVEFLVSMQTELHCNNDLPEAIKKLKKKIPQHMERLRDNAWQDKALRFQTSPRALLPEQLEKNRFPELAPAYSDLVYLRRYPTHDDNSDYISAVVVDGARAKRQFLASQLPLPTTLSDFWRLIAEQKIELVIVLQSPDLTDPTCCEIIPGEGPLNPVPYLNVELKVSSGPEKPPRSAELLLTDTSEGTPRTQRVNVLTCVEWGQGKGGKPPPPNELVELWTASENVHREGPTLVLCHDGVTGCGLYLSLSFMLERMAVERECDVIFAVRAIRRARAEFVQSKKQFEYLYDAAAKYVESFETYANFT